MSYALEKFQKAVLELAGSEPQRERLIKAYEHQLAYLDQPDSPETLWPEFEAFRKEITSKAPLYDKGRVEVTVKALPVLKVKKLIESVFSMYESVILSESKGG